MPATVSPGGFSPLLLNAEGPANLEEKSGWGAGQPWPGVGMDRVEGGWAVC